MSRRALLALALALLAGCATTAPRGSAPSPMPEGRSGGETARREEPPPTPAPAPARAPSSPMPETRVGSTASGGTIAVSGRPTFADTLPNSDGKAVLEGIPEPLPASQRVAPPAGEPVAASDSARASADTSDAGEGDVPVPEPTRALGDRPRPVVTDTSAATAEPAAPPPPSAPSTPPANPPSAAAKPDTCWRLQLAAVPESERAERLKSGAESQLGVPCVVEKEKSLYKVRTRDCQDGAAVERMRKRAVAVGFSGAFRFRDRAK